MGEFEESYEELYSKEINRNDESGYNMTAEDLEAMLYSQVHYASNLVLSEAENSINKNVDEVVDEVLDETDTEVAPSSVSNKILFQEVDVHKTWSCVLGMQGTQITPNKTVNDSEWNVNDLDRGSEKVSKTQRYYIDTSGENLPNIFCYNCDMKGHMAKDCTAPKKIPTCYLCGEAGHIRYNCTNDLCYNCMEVGHISKDCVAERSKPWYSMKCSRCYLKGHDKYMCPEIWRQYHITTEDGYIAIPKKLQERNRCRYCYNCASKNHFGESCREFRPCKRTVFSQFITKYDKPNKPPLDKDEAKGKNKAKKKKEEKENCENSTSTRDEKDDEKVNLSKSDKTKTIEKTKEKKKKKKLEENSAEIKSKKHEKVNEDNMWVVLDDIEEQPDKKLKTTTKKKKSKKTAVEKENDVDSMVAKTTNIRSNLWISDEDLTINSEEALSNNEKSFSMNDCLGIEKFDCDSKKNKNKKAWKDKKESEKIIPIETLSNDVTTSSKKRKRNKEDNIVENNIETTKPAKKYKTSKVVVVVTDDDITPKTNKSKSKSGADDIIPKTNKPNSKRSKKEQQLEDIEDKTTESSNKSKLNQTERKKLEKKKQRDLQSDLDNMTLSKLRDILHSDNNTSDEEGGSPSDLRALMHSPDINLTHSNVNQIDQDDLHHVIHSSKTSRNNAHQDIKDSYSPDNLIIDYTRYNPAEINQDGLALYGLVAPTKSIPTLTSENHNYETRSVTRSQTRSINDPLSYEAKKIKKKRFVPVIPPMNIILERRKTRKEKKDQDKRAREEDPTLMQKYMNMRKKKAAKKQLKKFKKKKEYMCSHEREEEYVSRFNQIEEEIARCNKIARYLQ